tara:strand:- start:36628 stop:37218 length:591 start_codon:yes stop_codon:yes gene_type:complete
MVMQDSDKANFESLLRGIADVFSTTKTIVVNRPMLQVYFMTLNRFSYEQVEWAIGEHLIDSVDGKFFPKPANIIKHLEKNVTAVEDKSLLAWNQIIREMRRVGAYGSLKLDDKQALAAIKAVKTWKDLCATPEKDLTWVKKEFIANYKTYENTPLELLPSSLPGLEELHDHKNADKDSYAKITDGINKFRLDNKQQ